MSDMVMKFREAGAVRAGPGRRLMVLACPFGSPADRDHLNEYFSARTDFMVNLGDRRPTLYFHGFTPDKKMTAKPSPIGVATADHVDDEGWWWTADLKEGRLGDRLLASAEAGTCRASTGAVNYLCRSSKDGEVEVWPIGEVSLLDEGLGRHPVSDKAVAIPLRASFEACDLEIPKAFGEDATDDRGALVSNPTRVSEVNMSEIDVAVKAALDAREAAAKATADAEVAMRAKVVKELEGEPKYKAMFNIAKETKRGLSPEKEETYEYIWNLRHGGTREMRVMEEAATGLPLVPEDMLNQIVELRDAISFGRKAGMPIFQTDKHILNIPVEATAMVPLPVIVESAPYIINEPDLDTVPITVVKHGSMITVTEEFLEDQNLFQAFLVRACGRAWGLAENVDVAAVLSDHAVIPSVEMLNIPAVGSPTDAEILAWYFALAQEYRDGAALFMNDDLMAFLRSAVIATPRAYGDFPLFGGGEYESFLSKRIFTNGNFHTWAASGTGDLIAVFGNLSAGFAFVERRGLSIAVDPYTRKGAAGEIMYYPSARWCCAVTNPAAFAAIESHT